MRSFQPSPVVHLPREALVMMANFPCSGLEILVARLFLNNEQYITDGAQLQYLVSLTNVFY